MPRYIDAEPLMRKAFLCKNADFYAPDSPFYAVSRNDIKAAPTIDMDEIRGVATWIPSKYVGYLTCSRCHNCCIDEEWLTDVKWNFCPDCGAKMTKEEPK